MTYLFCFFQKRNTDNPIMTQTRQPSSWCWSKQRSTNRETLHATFHRSWWKPKEVSLQKKGEFLDEEMSPPFQPGHASKKARRSYPGHART